ncbi:Sodium-coupled neutral amino acid transporter 3 [Labeo rohita]|uniref:Sodium-coupled neutral amino acid transporter 3 n=1 Tax=Labeo rohita TaxID=84645 RepID=A0ABQ8MFM3_LABRO|nr:Sodium-coupled neutral amino acid transporter 3 [Labeo rohita]
MTKRSAEDLLQKNPFTPRFTTFTAQKRKRKKKYIMELQKLTNGHHPDFQHLEEGYFEGKTSFGMSVFNLSNAIMGSGILGLSYAMSNTGIILFLILLTCIAVLSSYSVHLLLRSAGVVEAGQYATKLSLMYPSLFLSAMSSYLFIVKYELPLVIQAFLGLQHSSGIIYTFCGIFSVAGYLGYTSGFSLTCMVFFLISVIYKKFNIPCPFDNFTNHTTENITIDGECEAKYFTINQQTAYTVPILAFAFVCHPEVLPIYTELRNPTKRRMQAIANVSILGMFVMYLLTAIFGYLTFYLNTEAELLHTYSKVDPLDTLILCVRLAVLVAVTLTVPVVLFPIRRALLQLLFPDKPFHWVRHISIALCLLFVVNLLVIFVPNIRDIFGIIGCLLHCSGLHLYEHELDVHHTGLGLRRESKWRRSLIFNHNTVRVQKAFLEEHRHPSPELERETKTSHRLDPTHLRSVFPLSKERTDVLPSLK